MYRKYSIQFYKPVVHTEEANMKSNKKIVVLVALAALLAMISFATLAKGESVRLTQPRIGPVPESEWSDAQKKLLTPIKPAFKDGRVINIFTTLSRYPKLYESWMNFGMHVLQTSSLPARDREILILRIGWLCQSVYEFGQHTVVGKQAGLTDEEILRITKGPEAPGWSALDRALLRATDELHRDAFITDNTWKALSANYNENQLIDVIFTVGQYVLVSMALNSLGIQLDPGIPGFPVGSGK
jgi:4-carboxymuconolactone decarboxylase